MTARISPVFLTKNVRLVKGFFENTVDSYDGGPIALLHIDVDLYESYRAVLKKFFPQVANGGVILFDEYKSPRWPGATKAIDEFFRGTPYRIDYDEKARKYFVIKKS